MEGLEEIPPCTICTSWPQSKKFSENDLFELVRVSHDDTALMQWLSVFQNIDADVYRKSVAICEVHFIKDDLSRGGYDEKGLPLLKLRNESVIPTFITYEECLVNNRIGSYTDFLLDYHACLNTQPWNMEATEDEVTFMLKNTEIVLRIKSSMDVVVQEGSSTFEQGSILQSHLNNGIIEYWSNLRGLMLFCEENTPLTEVMARLGATVVLEGNEDDMFSSLDDVLCYVKTILDENWFYEMFSDSNYIVGFQIESRGTPHITKAIKVYPDFSMTGYVNGEIIGTKTSGTIRFLQTMNKEEVPPCLVQNENDEPNWDTNAIDPADVDHIHSFDFLVENANQHFLPTEWQLILLENHLLLYKGDMKAIPKLKCAIKFSKKLNCSIYINGTQMDMNLILPSFVQSPLTFTTLDTMIQIVNDIEETTNLPEDAKMEEGEMAPLIKQENNTTEQGNVSGPANKRSLEFFVSDENISYKKTCIEIEDSDLEVIDTDDPLNIIKSTSNETETFSTSLTCSECGEVKATQNALVRHMIKHKKEFPCQLCSKKFKTPKDLRRHMDLKHVVTQRYDCTECEKYFLIKGDLEFHITHEHANNVQYLITEVNEETANSNEKRFVCHICHTTFKQKPSLNRHVRTIHINPSLEKYVGVEKVDGQSVFICKICKRQSQFYKLIIIHVESHLNELQDGNVLETEESNNRTLTQMNEQIVINPEYVEEEGETILGGNVDEADQQCSEADNFELVYGHDFQEDLNCDEDDEFPIDEFPGEDGLWHCSLCPYKGKSQKNLKYHGLYHKSKYHCAICSRYYPSKFHLKRHMNTHLNEISDDFVEPLNDDAFSELDSAIMIDDSNEIEIKTEFIG